MFFVLMFWALSAYSRIASSYSGPSPILPSLSFPHPPPRADREKAVLQAKLRAFQRSSSEVAASQKSSASSGRKDEEATPALEEQHTLKSRIFELENQVNVTS